MTSDLYELSIKCYCYDANCSSCHLLIAPTYTVHFCHNWNGSVQVIDM